jgi:hypothetical protein
VKVYLSSTSIPFFVSSERCLSKSFVGTIKKAIVSEVPLAGDLVQSCLESSEVDKRTKILQRINLLLAVEDMINFLVITNDCIDNTLDLLEERLNGKLKTEVI